VESTEKAGGHREYAWAMRGCSLLCALAFVAGPGPAAAKTPSTVTLSIVGTSDLHGQIAALPWLSGYLENLRAARARDGGAVIVVDAGDLFQGTLESNLNEGAAVVAAYNAMGYTAATLGNHEFDFGPVGPAASPAAPGDDPRGALKARMAQASFPFLAANVVDEESHQLPTWPNLRPSLLVTVAGIEVGIVGAASAATGRLTLPANVAGLDFLPVAGAIRREARKLRARGAKVVVAIVHEGGACQDLTRPRRLASCDRTSPLFALARDLPSGSVDVIVGGHTHQAVAHFVRGKPVVQAFGDGRAFGRVDLTFRRKSGRLLSAHIEPPRELCPSGSFADCAPGKYEGAPVKASEAIVALNAPAFAAARKKGEERLGVEVLRPLPRRRGEESALGNLLADLVRQARPDSDVAVLNAGGIRADLPAGPLTYGNLYEAFPYDNVFASLRVSAGEFRALLARSLVRASSLVSLSGIRVRAHCEDGWLSVTLTRTDGTPIHDSEPLVVATTDFLATGGDGFFAGAQADLESGALVREAVVEKLRQRGGVLDPNELLDPKHPRFDLPGPVPIRCPR
jgi:2',3'-cyclic-nucleotide 2'-phosphodiesterase (5'-nucleotidase family)